MVHQVQVGFTTLMERYRVFSADQRHLAASLGKVVGHQQQNRQDFDQFSHQAMLNETYFEQRHHEHDVEIQQLKEDNARLHQVMDALQQFFLS